MSRKRELAAAIERDDALEEAGMHGDDRATCWTHQCWASQCASDPWHTRISIARPYRHSYRQA